LFFTKYLNFILFKFRDGNSSRFFIYYPPLPYETILYSDFSIYDVATEGSNVLKGEGEARSVYTVLSAVVGIIITIFFYSTNKAFWVFF